MARHTSDSYLRRQAKKRHRNAAVFNLVQALLADGCPKKSLAVKEAAAKLRRSERSVWTSLKEHPQELAEEERIDRRWDIEHGLVEPTEEEQRQMNDEAETLYYEWLK